ncbi:helix-turn-helix transcriptional regulator [Sphingopyxis sp. MG]|uniref:helix-turn-helix transcriptional regulator n=1 Tax=Sphingopyxis sp. MG TaxID=1866325 RepID=UPI001F453FE3|nr:AlpA family phage regulatory protein [Sphingopyxis sp. MG]
MEKTRLRKRPQTASGLSDLHAMVADHTPRPISAGPYRHISAPIASPHHDQELQMPSLSDRPVKRSIRRNELREIVPLADSTIYEMEQRGEFPRRFALSPRCVVWDLAEVEAWLESRRTRPIPRAKHPDVAQRKFRPVKGQGRAQA